ncbi:MAG TPA: hypothetical protein VF746_14715 [Longimicrobium sp.]|jgi:hypothetical protein
MQPAIVRREPLWPGADVSVDVLSAPVTTLAPDEVFVFGSNASGFHGAGSAGLACRGVAANTWRGDPWFLRARASAPGSPDRIGRWAVYGVARGYQEGRSGRSYAVVTIQRAGQLRSTPLPEIAAQLDGLADFARAHPHLTFLVTPLGEGYSGYTRAEMQALWRDLHERAGLPANLRFIRLAEAGDRALT